MSPCRRRPYARPPSPVSGTFAKQMPLPQIRRIPPSSAAASPIGCPTTGERTDRKHAESGGKRKISCVTEGSPRGFSWERKSEPWLESRQGLAFGAENSVSSSTRKWSTLLEARRNTSLLQQVREEKSAVPHAGRASSSRKKKKRRPQRRAARPDDDEIAGDIGVRRRGEKKQQIKRATLARSFPAALEEKNCGQAREIARLSAANERR